MKKFPNRTWAEIDLDALKNNIINIKNHVGDEVEVLAVVKADGYGHGAVKCAETMLENGASRLAVAFTDEAVELRNAGIDAPIQLLGYSSRGDYPDIIKYDVIPAIFSYDDAAELSDMAKKQGKRQKIHIKLDTGMNRIGYNALSDAAIDEIERISMLKGVEIEGIFTHFSCADSENEDYTYMQFDRFCSVIKKLENRGINIKIKHVCNSAGLIKYKNMHLDMVRAGIICYGLKPSNEVDGKELNLKPVLSLKTKVSRIEYIEKGEKISYGATFEVNEKTKIATIMIGYADGFIRAFSGKTPVIAGKKFVNIVGRICMDQCMIDVTSVNNISVEDEVIIIGESENLKITADDASQAIGTIGYELVCIIGKRVPRVYLKNGVVTDILNELV